MTSKDRRRHGPGHNRTQADILDGIVDVSAGVNGTTFFSAQWSPRTEIRARQVTIRVDSKNALTSSEARAGSPDSRALRFSSGSKLAHHALKLDSDTRTRENSENHDLIVALRGAVLTMRSTEGIPLG